MSYCKYVNEDGDYCIAIFKNGELIESRILARKEQAGDWSVVL